MQMPSPPDCPVLGDALNMDARIVMTAGGMVCHGVLRYGISCVMLSQDLTTKVPLDKGQNLIEKQQHWRRGGEENDQAQQSQEMRVRPDRIPEAGRRVVTTR